MDFPAVDLLPGSLPNVNHAKTFFASEVPRVINNNNIPLNIVRLQGNINYKNYAQGSGLIPRKRSGDGLSMEFFSLCKPVKHLGTELSFKAS